MNSNPAGLRQLDGIIWAMIAAVAAAVLAATALSDFHLEWRSFSLPAVATGLFAAGQAFYQARRPDPRRVYLSIERLFA
jgi:hypothetical protein